MAAAAPQTSANLVDRVIGWINPHAGLSRWFARQRLQRAYEAASPRDPWKPRRAGASANADHQADAAMLRAKCRSLVQNVPYISAALSYLVTATVGTGILPRSKAKAAGTRATLDRLFSEWMPVCDADGKVDFHGLVAAAYRAVEQDGEVLVRIRARRPTDGLPVPLQLQLLEIDWLDSTKTGAEGGNFVTNGIEHDQLGRVVAYWLWEAHPGDVTIPKRIMRTRSRRVPAASIIHLFALERPGQARGFPRFSPVIARVRDLQLYEDAELARKNLETRLGALVSGDVASMGNPGDAAVAPDPAKAGSLGELASGGITQLPPGMNVQLVEPKAAPGHVEYVKHQLHIISAACGVPYEAMTGDVGEVNFSSARVRLLDVRRSIEQVRWLLLVPRLLTIIWTVFVDAAHLANLVPTADAAVDFSTPKWDYVNPQQDVRADIEEMSVGLASLSEKLRQRGYSPDDVFAEIAADFEKLKKLGILDFLLFKEKGAKQQTPAADEPVGATKKGT